MCFLCFSSSHIFEELEWERENKRKREREGEEREREAERKRKADGEKEREKEERERGYGSDARRCPDEGRTSGAFEMTDNRNKQMMR